ncbi:YadA-like family protein [Taylorella equigenitalis]|uniref:YadA-like family protein n=2 Tax=Taylorella equigenitalis TaxID=29575 RepID=UPI000F6E3192|nr:YadA-like family protein [Taylorella equigenitalis]VEG30486.1 YadA-like C-terminal region [Taylorella equigenitalis ATCC 35865]
MKIKYINLFICRVLKVLKENLNSVISFYFLIQLIVLFPEAKSTALVQSESNRSYGSPSAAFGHGNTAFSHFSSAIGVSNVAREHSSSAIGTGNLSGWVRGNRLHQLDPYLDPVSLTQTFVVTPEYINRTLNASNRKEMVAMGVYNMAFGNRSLALGNRNITLADETLAVGKSNLILGSYSNVIGNSNTALSNYSNVLGFSNAIGESGLYSFALGSHNNIRSQYGLAIGYKNTIKGTNSIFIGNNNLVLGDKNIVIGNLIQSNSLSNSIVLGNESDGTYAEELSKSVSVEFGNLIGGLIISEYWNGWSYERNGSLSVGARGRERQIKNVATGAVSRTSTDAVNGSQLYSAINAIGEATRKYSMFFSADNYSNRIESRLGDILSILGGATGLLSDRNIGVIVNGNTINVKLAKKIKSVSSVTTDGGTVLSDEAIRLGQNGPSITHEGINSNNKKIFNVLTEENSSDSDAANVGFVTKKLDNLKNQGYSLIDDSDNLQSFSIGSSIKVLGDKNIYTTISKSGVNIQMQSNLLGIRSVDIDGGPTLNSEGLSFGNGTKLTSDKLQIGTVLITTKGKITGVADPTDDTDAANKRYVDRQLYSLGNKPLTLGTNDGQQSKKLGDTMTIKGADSNFDKNLFDGGNNIMTWIDGEGGIRIGIKKDISLYTFTSDNGSGKSSTLRSDALVFNGVDGIEGADGQITLDVTSNGMRDVRYKKSARLKLNNTEVATMNDGLRLGANSGNEALNHLNSKVVVSGNKNNIDWSKFDEGSNIMTNISQSPEDQTNITIALKRDLELDSATIGHGPNIVEGTNITKGGKDGYIKVVNKEGKTAIVIDGGNTSNDVGPSITVSDTKSVAGGGTSILSNGIEFNTPSTSDSKTNSTTSKSSKAFVSIAPEGSARIEQDASARRTRLTLKSGEGSDSTVEEIATMNDGLRFKGDSEELINKPLSSTLSIVGGETDSTKLTSSKEDKNIGVIVEDAPSASKDSNTKSQKVLAVRLSKNLKGLQSAEFKPVDENSKPTGQTITIGKEGLTISNKDKKSQFNEEGLKIGENGPSVTDKGINAGGMNISNVAPPTQPHHASTKGYVDTQVRHLESKINERYKDALGASAMAMATALLPPPNTPGRGVFSVASAVVAGQPAFALGVSVLSENNRLILKGAVASDVRSQVGGGVGASYQW